MKQPKERPLGPKFKLFEKDGEQYVYERHIVHQFNMSDCEDPDLYVASPIHDWQQTEQGSWVMKHTLEPTYHIHADHITFGYKVIVTAYVTPKRWTEYILRGWFTG